MPILKMTLKIEEVGRGIIINNTQSVAESEAVLLEYDLATGTADQAIPTSFVTGITAAYILALQSDQAISWRLSATDTAIDLDADGIAVLFGTDIAALLLTNASGSTAHVTVFNAG